MKRKASTSVLKTLASAILLALVVLTIEGENGGLRIYSDKLDFQEMLWNVKPVPAISYPVCFNRTESTLISQATLETCCAPWDYNLDDWWLHRPDWEVSLQNDTMTCFSPMRDVRRANIMRQIHDNQWNRECSNFVYAPLISSGYGASVDYFAKPMAKAVAVRRPFVPVKHWEGAQWFYSTRTINKNTTRICPSADFSCYFLNVTRCTTNEYFKNPNVGRFKVGQDKLYAVRWYLTRPQQWLRKQVYDYIKSNYIELSSSSASLAIDIPPKQPCKVFHVRRTDIVLDRGCRRYKRLQEYIDLSNTTKGETIVLLTEDQSTIDEAMYLHSNDYRWLVVNRTRFRGMEGRFENHLPSNDGLKEIVAILAELEVASYCTTFAHTKSGFGDFVGAWMYMRNTVRVNQTEPPLRSITDVQVPNGACIEGVDRVERIRQTSEFLEKLYEDIEISKQQLKF